MPSQYIDRKLIPFSQLEGELLAYLAEIDRRSMASHVRDALRLYARQHPSFDGVAFARRITKNVLPKAEGPRKRVLQEDLEAFVRFLGGEEATQRDTVSLEQPFDSADVFSK